MDTSDSSWLPWFHSECTSNPSQPHLPPCAVTCSIQYGNVEHKIGELDRPLFADMCRRFESECARRLAEETEYLSIEKRLDDMDEAWRSTDLLVVPHKDSGPSSQPFAFSCFRTRFTTCYADRVGDRRLFRTRITTCLLLTLALPGHHTLMATDEQFQQLEDHRKSVSSMKASRFSLDFAGRLIFWENARLAANPHLGLRSTLNARRD